MILPSNLIHKKLYIFTNPKTSQQSLDSGTLPPIWKEANVAPVYTKGERSNPTNYRPISITCILCKTLEHIVASSIKTYLS